jgi:hypothetical protein
MDFGSSLCLGLHVIIVCHPEIFSLLPESDTTASYGPDGRGIGVRIHVRGNIFLLPGAHAASYPVDTRGGGGKTAGA